MFNNIAFDEKQLSEWSKQFNAAKPFRFLVIDNFLNQDLAINLSTGFPSLEEMDVNYKGINERKSEHSSFNNLHQDFTCLKSNLSSQTFSQAIEKITQIQKLETIDDRYGYGLHQGGTNSFLDIHIDYNLHPIKKRQRRLNLIIFLNKEWQENWGGALEFWNNDMNKCVHSILPVFNRCVLFECNNYSFHGYSKITCPSSVTRKSFYLYFFSEPEKKLLFHDTIFKNKPEEPTTKKVTVHLKETFKNLLKQIFYYLGLRKLLK